MSVRHRSGWSVVGLGSALVVLTLIGCGGIDAISSQAGTGGAGGQGVGGQGMGGEGAGGAGSGGQGGSAACEDAPAAPCSTGWILNFSRICGQGGNPGTITCGASMGDGLCYKQCKASSDCPDPCFPHCNQHIIFLSSDAGEQVSYCER